MNKRVVIVLSLLITGALGFGLVRSSNQPSTPSTPAINSNQNTSSSDTPANGTYVAYSPAVVSETTGTKVLFFHAPWCPQCRSIEAGINAQGVPNGLTIIKVDYDTNQELRQKYGVTLQTTFVKIDDEGNFISKYVAYDEPTFYAVKRNYL